MTSGVTFWNTFSGVSIITTSHYREPEARIVYRDRYVSEPKVIEKPVYRDVIKEVIVEKPVIIYKEVPMHWTWTNIAIVVLIVLFTVKVILPRFNWRFGIRFFVRLFWKPAKKEVGTITTEWKEANKE